MVCLDGGVILQWFSCFQFNLGLNSGGAVGSWDPMEQGQEIGRGSVNMHISEDLSTRHYRMLYLV